MTSDAGDGPVLHAPRGVQEIAERLEDAGYETWCVGGAVRDALLGQRHLDWDLATAATPDQVRRVFRRTVPVGEKFGTIGVLDATGRMHEVTTFRHDVRTDGRHAVVEFGASLDEDLARRDFTINAIAWSTRRQRLHDPFGGRQDLDRGVVRAVGDAPMRMAEDRLRALRALRFAGRFGFTIDKATWAAIAGSAPALHRLSKERIQQELVKTLEQVRHPSHALELWRTCGALEELVPALARQAAWHLRAADVVALPDDSLHPGIKRRRTLVRLAAITGGLTREQVHELLTGLRFSNRDVQRTGRLVPIAAEVERALSSGQVCGDAALRGWASTVGRVDAADLLRIAVAGATAHDIAPTASRQTWCGLYRRAVRTAYRDPIELADLVVDGEDLLRAGVPAGPALGRTLKALLAHVLDHPGDNRPDVLLERARQMEKH